MSKKKAPPWDFPTFISKQISNKKWPTQRVHCAGFKLNSFCFFWCAHVSSKQQSIMKQLEFNFKAMCQAWCQVVLRQQIHQGILKNWIHALGKFFSQGCGVSECRYVKYIVSFSCHVSMFSTLKPWFIFNRWHPKKRNYSTWYFFSTSCQYRYIFMVISWRQKKILLSKSFWMILRPYQQDHRVSKRHLHWNEI